MLRASGLPLLLLAFAFAGNACSNGGSSGGGNASAGMPGSMGGSDEPGGGRPSTLPDAGAPSEADAGSAGDSAMSDAGAPSGGTGGTGSVTPETEDPTNPGVPFDLGAAATSLGQTLDTTQQALDAQTVEYTLVGPSSSALVDRTLWSTAPEAEFECSRGSANGALVVGSDRMLFIATDSVWLSLDTACLRVSVSLQSVYSATLTRSFAQDVLGAP